jgi:hypothetical protein
VVCSNRKLDVSHSHAVQLALLRMARKLLNLSASTQALSQEQAHMFYGKCKATMESLTGTGTHKPKDAGASGPTPAAPTTGQQTPSKPLLHRSMILSRDMGALTRGTRSTIGAAGSALRGLAPGGAGGVDGRGSGTEEGMLSRWGGGVEGRSWVKHR